MIACCFCHSKKKEKVDSNASLILTCFHRRQFTTNEPNRGIKEVDRRRSTMATSKPVAKPVAKPVSKPAAKPVKK
jgi:hypothetical protein